MKELAPIVVFVYNRPKHTEVLLKSLSECKLAKESSVYIFSDAAKDDSVAESVELVRNIINSKEWEQLFKDINVVEAKQNKGLANSVIFGVSQIINMYGKVIVVEDDNRVAYDFLEFMNEALTFYENNPKIGYIGGYTLPIKFPHDYAKDVFLTGRGSSYAWATWKDIWNLVDWEVKDFNQLKKDKKAIQSFNMYGEDRFDMLSKQVQGKMNSWAIRFAYSLWKANKFAILPCKTRVENIGFDGSGVHNVEGDVRFAVSLENNLKAVKFEEVEENELIIKEYQRIFKVPFVLKVKRIIKKILQGRE